MDQLKFFCSKFAKDASKTSYEPDSNSLILEFDDYETYDRSLNETFGEIEKMGESTKVELNDLYSVSFLEQFELSNQLNPDIFHQYILTKYTGHKNISIFSSGELNFFSNEVFKRLLFDLYNGKLITEIQLMKQGDVYFILANCNNKDIKIYPKNFNDIVEILKSCESDEKFAKLIKTIKSVKDI